MTPDQVEALSGLVESLAWLAVLSGVIGGILFSALAKFAVWAMESCATRQFKEYRASCRLRRRREFLKAKGVDVV